MTGIYQHTLDAKGRLFIPAKLREELGDTFYVTVSPEKCLSAYSQENWKAISEKAAAMTNLQQRKVRPLFAYAARCDLDGQGRILLPQHLREFAGLTKSVTVVGSNNHAEFWDSARWDEICPLEAPVCTCGFVQTLRSVSRKPILPGEEELECNPRARSAKLRVAERV